jgi:hypothetical protein
MIGTKITKDLGNNKYEVVIDDVDTNTNPTVVGVAHDYVLFSGWTNISTEHPLMLKTPGGGGSNVRPIKTVIQIPIKIMGEVAMPYLNNHPWLKENHFKRYDVLSPDAPIITWTTDTLHIYDKEKEQFVSISKSLYNQLTKA